MNAALIRTWSSGTIASLDRAKDRSREAHLQELYHRKQCAKLPIDIQTHAQFIQLLHYFDDLALTVEHLRAELRELKNTQHVVQLPTVSPAVDASDGREWLSVRDYARIWSNANSIYTVYSWIRNGKVITRPAKPGQNGIRVLNQAPSTRRYMNRGS